MPDFWQFWRFSRLPAAALSAAVGRARPKTALPNKKRRVAENFMFDGLEDNR
jgi:hypothetical protein